MLNLPVSGALFFSLSYIPHQTLGVLQPGPGESPAFLNVDRTGDVWVQVGDTSWLLDLHDDVSIVTNFENALRLEVVTPEGAGVVEVLLRYGGGERELEVEWRGEGVGELSGGVQLEENRGKPMKVRSCDVLLLYKCRSF